MRIKISANTPKLTVFAHEALTKRRLKGASNNLVKNEELCIKIRKKIVTNNVVYKNEIIFKVKTWCVFTPTVQQLFIKALKALFLTVKN